jgi:hypothetical protein
VPEARGIRSAVDEAPLKQTSSIKCVSSLLHYLPPYGFTESKIQHVVRQFQVEQVNHPDDGVSKLI